MSIPDGRRPAYGFLCTVLSAGSRYLSKFAVPGVVATIVGLAMIYLLVDVVGEYTIYRTIPDEYQLNAVSAAHLETNTRIRALIFGDSGDGSASQQLVAKSMWQYCDEFQCNFAIGLGDNLYPRGASSVLDPMWQSAFELPFRDFVDDGQMNFWMAVGNHDRLGNVEAQIEYSHFSAIWRMPAADYEIPNLPSWVKIYVIDTSLITRQSGVPGFEAAYLKDFNYQLERARKALCTHSQSLPSWRILVTHHPMVSSGRLKNKPKEQVIEKQLKPLIESCNVDLILSGHEHLQELLEVGSILQLVQGAASSANLGGRGKSHGSENAVSAFSAHTIGFSTLSIYRHRLIIEFRDGNGRLLYKTTRCKDCQDNEKGLL